MAFSEEVYTINKYMEDNNEMLPDIHHGCAVS